MVGRLRAVLLEIDAPILRVAEASSRPEEPLATHLGSRRASTLAARTRAWARYRGWLRRVHGIGHPAAASPVLECLTDRRAEPFTRGTFSAVFSAVRFADQILGVPKEDRWSLDVNVVPLVKGIIAEAAPTIGARSQGPAESPVPGLLAKLETVVCKDPVAIDRRLLAWWMFLSSWASMRFDDRRGLAPSSVAVCGDRMNLELVRTKTTGADKAVRRPTCLVGEDTWLVEPNWNAVGWQPWQSAAPIRRGYLLTQQGPEGVAVPREMSYIECSGRTRAVLAELSGEDGSQLGVDAAVHWRPRAWRSFVPSVAVALGAPGESSKWLTA